MLLTQSCGCCGHPHDHTTAPTCCCVQLAADGNLILSCGAATTVVKPGAQIAFNEDGTITITYPDGSTQLITLGDHVTYENGLVTITHPDGSTEQFHVGDQLTINDNGTVTITRPDGSTDTFNLHAPATVTYASTPYTTDPAQQHFNIPKPATIRLSGIAIPTLPSFLNAISTVLQWSQVTLNDGGFIVDKNQRIIVPHPGLYHISATLTLTGPTIELVPGNSTARLQIAVFVNDGSPLATNRVNFAPSYLPAGTHQFWTAHGAAILRLAANDALIIPAQQTSRKDLPTNHPTYGPMLDTNHFEVTYLGGA